MLNARRVAALAALLLVSLAAQAAPSNAPKKRPRIQVAFVLDTTGSMGGLLEGAKQKIFSIASRIAEGRPTPELELALVGYRDVGDAYVTRRTDFTGDLDRVFTELRRLEASGGGDGPEHVGRALGEAVSLLAWDERAETMKLVFLVGDAPPGPREPEWDAEAWAKKAAARHLVVHAVRCGADPETERTFRRLAALTDGAFHSIDAAGGMVAVSTPYDARVSELSAKLAASALYAGKGEARRASLARAEAVGALAPEAAAERVSFAQKKARAAGDAAPAAAPAPAEGAVDLAARPEALAGLADDALPDALRTLPPPQREAAVRARARERAALEQELARVSAERDAWRRAHVADKADGLDARVLQSVRARAARFGLTY